MLWAAIGMTAQTVTIEAESMTPGGQYAGKCQSPFSGMGFYANGDCATGYVTLPKKSGVYNVSVIGASSDNSGAGIALYVGGTKAADFTFYGNGASTKSTQCRLFLNSTSAQVKLNLETDNGSNDTFVDKVVFTLVSEIQERNNPVLPAQGAYYTGQYRNLFVEAGYSESQVSQRLQQLWNQLFYGSDGREDGQRVYYPVNGDEAYILDVNNDDVRSEGQSYGMMICVQMNKQQEFNRLWKWARTHMQHRGNEFDGYFAWQMNKNGTIRENAPAPDGEEYFITALMLAANRWGNGTGIYNYMAEANYILKACVNKPLSQYPFSSVTNIFDKTQKQVVFVPFATSADKTDPSYHLPAFYKLWALWADENNDFWDELAQKSREMFPKFAHATTGLMPDYANFDGTPNGEGGHNNFRYDAWRCMMNMGCDYAWWKECADETTLVKRAHSFFIGKGVKQYYSNYSLEGNPESGNTSHSPGLVACNAVGALASDSKAIWDFIDDFWETPIPSGRYRYYDGMLYFLGFLHASGNFRIYYPNGSGVHSATINDKGQMRNDQVVYDLQGRRVNGSWSMVNGPRNATLSKRELPKGLYIVNGRKVVMK